MKDKLKAHFLKFGPRAFVSMTVLVLLITDVLNSYYLKLWWQAMNISQKFIEAIAKVNQANLEDFSSDTLVESRTFINKMFTFFLLIVFANNLFFYLFYLRKKLWAQGYVLAYTLTAALFAVSFIIDTTNLGVGWKIYNLSTILIYAYLFVGVKVTKMETTLAGGKKGR